MTDQTKIAGIPRFPQYQFAADGNVVSTVFKTKRTLKPIRMGEYRGLQLLGDDGKTHKAYVHRLIAEAFHGPAGEGQVCCHLNGDKNDNRAVNLTWASQSENNKQKRGHGTSPDGERNPMAKLNRNAVQAMRLARSQTGNSYAKIAEQFGVSAMTAYRAIAGQSWGEA
jgi:hypothetical protein